LFGQGSVLSSAPNSPNDVFVLCSLSRESVFEFLNSSCSRVSVKMISLPRLLSQTNCTVFPAGPHSRFSLTMRLKNRVIILHFQIRRQSRGGFSESNRFGATGNATPQSLLPIRDFLTGLKTFKCRNHADFDSSTGEIQLWELSCFLRVVFNSKARIL
jgi:hypothetical protein